MDRKKDYFGDAHPSYAERALILKAAKSYTQEGAYTDEALALLKEIPADVLHTYVFTYAPPILVPELKGYFMEKTPPSIRAVLADVINPAFSFDIETFTEGAEREVDLMDVFFDALGEVNRIDGLSSIYAKLISGEDVEIGESETPDGPVISVKTIDGSIAQRRAAIAVTCAVYKTIEALENALEVCNFKVRA